VIVLQKKKKAISFGELMPGQTFRFIGISDDRLDDLDFVFMKVDHRLWDSLKKSMGVTNGAFVDLESGMLRSADLTEKIEAVRLVAQEQELEDK